MWFRKQTQLRVPPGGDIKRGWRASPARGPSGCGQPCAEAGPHAGRGLGALPPRVSALFSQPRQRSKKWNWTPLRKGSAETEGAGGKDERERRAGQQSTGPAEPAGVPRGAAWTQRPRRLDAGAEQLQPMPGPVPGTAGQERLDLPSWAFVINLSSSYL